MARKPTGNPIGPPPKQIDFEKFEELCGFWCTTEEIAASLKVHSDTLRKRIFEHYGEEYSVIYKRFFNAGTPSFRRERRVLSKRNANMSIWLGKMHLGEREYEEKEKAPFQPQIDYEHALLRSEYKIMELEKKLNEFQSKATPELQRSN